jgi:glycosyltransferase involved in cell wall biosynthesis
VVTLSEPLAEQIHSNYGVPRNKIGLIPLAADPDEFTPREGNEEFFKVVYVGALREFRGINDLVHALAALEPELRSQIHLELYGEADEKFIQSLYDIAQDGLSINWHGYVQHDQLADKVATCDVAASPLPPLESFKVSSPAKIYEYLALGLPIVATNITPHKHILTGECSIFVPPNDTEAMTDAFKTVLSDSEYRSELSASARELALESTWTNRFEDYCGFLDEWS